MMTCKRTRLWYIEAVSFRYCSWRRSFSDQRYEMYSGEIDTLLYFNVTLWRPPLSKSSSLWMCHSYTSMISRISNVNVFLIDKEDRRHSATLHMLRLGHLHLPDLQAGIH